MSECLPYDDFRFLTDDEIKNFDYRSITDDAPSGFILEVDLDYPDYLHELHNDYPLAPESLLITKDMLSPFCRSFNTKHIDAKKLVPNLRSKTKYVIHYRNLKLYTSLGMVVTKIHRVLSFSQKPWMKSFIDFNTLKRRNAQNDFERDLYKLLINSTFGKCLENVRLRKDLQLVCDEKKLLKLSAKPQFESLKIINEGTVLFERVKKTITLNKPMYAGFCILEISKLIMYNFHYNVFLKRFPPSSVRLLFTDTDSLCYSVQCSDVYDVMALDKEWYDTSNFDPRHPLYSKVNQKVLGKFKDECGGKSPIEFVGLRAKMYSLLVNENEVKKTAKGVKRLYVQKRVRHDMYLNTLQTRVSTRADFVNFRSLCHNVQTVNFSRICLSSYDDKRHVCKNGVNTFAYGNCNITSDS